MKRIIVALMLAAAAFGVQAQQGNIAGTAFSSAARTAAQYNSADTANITGRGVIVIVDVTAATSGNYTFKVQGKDPASAKYFDILTSAAVSGTGTTVLRVYPGITTAANVAVSDVLPRTFRIQANGAATPNLTFSTGFIIVQ